MFQEKKSLKATLAIINEALRSMWEVNSIERATITRKWFRIRLVNEQLVHKNNLKEALKISEELVLLSDSDQ